MKARLHHATAIVVACVATACSDQSPGATEHVDVTLQQTDAVLAQVVSGWYASVDGGGSFTAAIDPDTVETLTIRITSIELLPEGSDEADDAGWVELKPVEPVLLDLMALPTEGESPLVIASGEAEVGSYSNVRLLTDGGSISFKGPISLGPAFTFAGGEVHQVDIPSGAETGIKTNASFTVGANGTANDVNLLFSSGSTLQNIAATGNDTVLLAPVIRERGDGGA